MKQQVEGEDKEPLKRCRQDLATLEVSQLFSFALLRNRPLFEKLQTLWEAKPNFLCCARTTEDPYTGYQPHWEGDSPHTITSTCKMFTYELKGRLKIICLRYTLQCIMFKASGLHLNIFSKKLKLWLWSFQQKKTHFRPWEMANYQLYSLLPYKDHVTPTALPCSLFVIALQSVMVASTLHCPTFHLA